MDKLPRIQQALFSACASLLSRGGAKGALLVLIYHRVVPKPDPLLAAEPDARTFAAQMDILRSTFNVIPLTEAIERMRKASLPKRAACITFDDGYVNNLEVAAPILAERKLPATVFVATQFMSGGRMWNDTVIEIARRAQGELDLTRFGLGRYVMGDTAARRDAFRAILDAVKYLEPTERARRVNAIAEHSGADLPNDLMMSAQMIRRLHAQGVEIGAHTESHPILAKTSEEQARSEIAGSKATLEDVIGAPVTMFAYPNGRPHTDYAERDVALVKACGFRGAVSTAWGCARHDSDLFQIPRVAPWDRTPARFAARLIKAYVDPIAGIV
ncbi:MAG: polysaccharide deacetylase family protein [Steroidobacter sp.]